MNKNEAIKLIKETFQNSYNEEKFKYFIKNIFKNIEEKDNTYSGQLIKKAYKDHIKSYKKLYKYQDSLHNEIDVLSVNISSFSSLEKARTTQRNFIASYLNEGGKNAVLVAFYTDEDEGKNWRFSFVIKESSIDFKTHKIETKFSPAKRYSYLVGETESSHTAQQQLLPLFIQENHSPSLEELESAFTIEKISKEFFEEYKKLYFDLVDIMTTIRNDDSFINTDFTLNKISNDLFCKKLLGQIVFLYFIQKKGWLGVEKNNSWGTGDKKFLRTLFDKAKEKGKNYFNDYLEPLFYDALATWRKNSVSIDNYLEPLFYNALATDGRNDNYYPQLNCKIPFLNGGLFDPINGYDWEKTDIKIPNEFFHNANNNGVLDIFDIYNFTVREDEPLEKEVAVDPEMLGKVFENLLDIKDRKSKGAFYTPREIVHYMCQESLINYLETKFQNKIPKEDIAFFIKYGDTYLEIEDKVDSVDSYEEIFHSSIKQNAKDIDEALENVKICDPAIGSGAFPVGLMQEIIKARRTLISAGFIKEEKKRTTYEYKRQVIQNSLYGVDIEDTAIEISKLRLWLSLIVDEDDINNIKPLPNLDYKFFCGNSLLSIERNLFNNNHFKEFERLKNVFFNTPSKIEKNRLNKEIKDIINKITKDKGFDFKIYFSEIFRGDNPGFDIIIGNPPYIQLQKFKLSAEDKKLGKKDLQELYKSQNFKVYEATGDIYCLFYEKGISLLQNNGRLCFITSNKWMRAGYGESLRNYLSKHNPKILIDLGGNVFETATVDTNILLIEKSENEGKTISTQIKDRSRKMSDLIKHESQVMKFDKNSWVILNDMEQSIKAKIEKYGTPLKDWDISINYGIKTGYNEAFIISGTKKDELIKKDPKSTEIIRPILRGKDIKRYGYEFADLWLIATFPSMKYDIENYPAIKQYLLDFGYDRLKQTGDKGARKKTNNKWFETQDSISYWDDFYKQKICWGGVGSKMKYAIVPAGFFVNAPANFLVSNYDDFLACIFNDNIIDWYYRTMFTALGENGIRFYVKDFLELPIPKTSINKKITSMEIYSLYHLTEEEIQYIKNSLK